MKKYLETLITEKGKQLDQTIQIDGHIGITYQMLVDFVHECPEQHAFIKDTIVKIDFKNGDVFHFLHHLAECMCKAVYR